MLKLFRVKFSFIQVNVSVDYKSYITLVYANTSAELPVLWFPAQLGYSKTQSMGKLLAMLMGNRAEMSTPT